MLRQKTVATVTQALLTEGISVKYVSDVNGNKSVYFVPDSLLQLEIARRIAQDMKLTAKLNKCYTEEDGVPTSFTVVEII